MNLQTLFGSGAVGKDTSGNFKHSVKGLAVRATPDGKFYAREGRDFIDVTDLTIDGGDNYIYRIPVRVPAEGEIADLRPGDIIVRSDSPTFSVLFVEKISRDAGHIQIEGWDPASNTCVHYCPSTNLFNCRWFVKVVSLLDSAMGRKDPCQTIAMLALLGPGQSDGGTTATAGSDLVSSLLLMRAIGGDKSGFDDWGPLILMTQGGKSDLLTAMLLCRGIEGGNPFNRLFAHGNEKSVPEKKR